MNPADPAIGDAFGEGLRACFDAGALPHTVTEIVERDDGFIGTGDMARYFAPPAEWREVERWALDGVTGRVLDIGAGAGRHALFLQDRGCDVTALDVSPLAIDICRSRGVRFTFAGTVEEFATTPHANLDALLLLGNNLGLLRDGGHAPLFLDRLASMARPGAVIVGTCLDPYRTADPGHLAYHERNRASGRMGGQVRMRIRHRGLATPWWDYLFLSPEELERLVQPTRWRIEAHRDDGIIYAVRMRLK